MYDIKITNGLLIDGSGAPGRPGELAVRRGRIAAVGATVAGAAQTTLDALGHVVCPGFIDLHTHCGVGHNLNYLQAGVTMVLGGNCGFQQPGALDGLTAKATGRCGPNIAYLSGHNSVRISVMGNVNRAPTAAELERMAKLVAADMKAGAMGLSAGLTYVPGHYAETPELIHLARVAADAGGIYTVHMRDESEGIFDSIAETVRIGVEGGLPAHVSHLKLGGTHVWGRSRDALATLDAARARGVDITWDQYPYAASCGRILLLFSQWLQEGTAAELRARFQDPAMRVKAREDLVARIERVYAGDGKRIVFAMAPDPSIEGRTLADVALASGRSLAAADMAETVLDLVVRYPEQGRVFMVSHSMNEEDVRRILRHPVTMVASDGWSVAFGKGYTHPRLYGTCPRVLGHYVRDEKMLSLDEAVRRMTSMPAARMGLSDRGVLAEGAWADLVVFDPRTVIDCATFENPHQYPLGIDYVMVNGVATIDHGRHTGALPGVFVHRPMKP